MESLGKAAIANIQDAKRFIPAIVRSPELSEPPDSLSATRYVGSQAAAKTQVAGTLDAIPKPDIVLIDRKVIDEAAAWIRAKVATTLRRGAEDVGEYVLDMFFGGDPALAKSRNPRKSVSFRVLAEKCGTAELPISKTWLNNAVGIAVTIRRLQGAGACFRALPPSYQETLLPLKDPGRMERLAHQALSEELSFRELRRVVAKERAGTPKADSRGRPCIPSIIKALGHSMKLLGVNGANRVFSRSEIGLLDEQQRKTARASAEKLRQRLKELIRSLG